MDDVCGFLLLVYVMNLLWFNLICFVCWFWVEVGLYCGLLSVGLTVV